jgi:hypothetical protein
VRAGDVCRRASHERFADADGSEDDDVPLVLEKTQAGKLGEQTLVETDLGGFVEQLQAHRGVETGFAGATLRSTTVPAPDFIGQHEHEQEQLLEREVLLVGEHESVRQGVSP